LVDPVLAGLLAHNWLRKGALVSVETDADEEVTVPDGYHLIDRRVTGRAAVTILQVT
jgi:16S rRNA G966 N2-methylase RsmD